MGAGTVAMGGDRRADISSHADILMRCSLPQRLEVPVPAPSMTH
jgi:hypothetical protein